MQLDPSRLQPSLPGFCPVEAAVATMAESGAEARGAVFTRREVVDFILDLIGYTVDQPLHRFRILEPATGQGDFLLPTIERLFEAYSKVPKAERTDVISALGGSLCAVELHRSSYDQCRDLVHALQRTNGVSARDADALCDRWLKQADFLLAPLDGAFTHVAGNPPYVRQELIPDVLMAEYRRRFTTVYDRADIYVPFIERSLSLLADGGKLGFICADRWMKNRYGGPLRRLIADQYRLKFFVDMVDTDAFQSDVIAYPAIVVIAREEPGPTRVAFRPPIDAIHLQNVTRALQKKTSDDGVTEIARVANGSEPWMLGARDELAVLRRLEEDFPTLEEVGCKVGIGVATGADEVFIRPFDTLDVEPDRKLPLVMTRDIQGGTVDWRGLGVINPFGSDGKLVSLREYPKLAAYLDEHGTAIKARHVSKKNPGSWFRTIDRIYPELTHTPKLLVPDIKGAAQIVFEPGNLYPHHNLYFVTSTSWELRALQAVLLSDVAYMFISLYSTKMRGGYLRFQAQYLRRIRIPRWEDTPPALRHELVAAGTSRDRAMCNSAVAKLYRLTTLERSILAAQNGAVDAA